MRLRITAVSAGVLFLLASLPGAASGHHKDNHPKPALVDGTTVDDEHIFDPDKVNAPSGGTVEFTNDEEAVAFFGAPHTWTVLTDGCDPTAPDAADNCEYDSGRVLPGETTTVELTGLAVGTYTFICTTGLRPPEKAFELVFQGEPHATKNDQGKWEGMVGELKVVGNPDPNQ